LERTQVGQHALSLRWLLVCVTCQVDAALDLSHTQNIGHMIKTHFPYSQFIVVSLKEGMFNNANVVFRTKFVDGVSAVTRTVPRQGSILHVVCLR
jgi:RecF/RecN/SMC N terminal domain